MVFADYSAISIANTYFISDKQAKYGDIISNSTKGLVRTTSPYQSTILGVLTEEPVAVFKADSDAEKPVATGGVVVVNVNSSNGEIKKGDFVTSSSTPGQGMKATNSGYAIGMAIDNASGGKVNVALRVEYAELSSPQTLKRLFDLLGRGIFQNVEDPDKFGQLIRYIAAGLAIIAAILLALLTFSRSVPKAIEAIGRNPLARTSIYLSLVVSVILMIVIIAMGIAGAVIVLRV